jgi:hypothetical protein
MPYQFDEFESCLNQPFKLELEGRTYPLELIAANRLDNTAKFGDRDAFSIIFRGSKQLQLDQQIYRIEHERLGTMELFIVPIGPDEQGMCYEAVFS